MASGPSRYDTLGNSTESFMGRLGSLGGPGVNGLVPSHVEVPMDAWTATGQVGAAERVSAFLWKVYAWMGIGLGITAAVAFLISSSPELLRALVGNRLVFFALVIAELGLVFYLSARVER